MLSGHETSFPSPKIHQNGTIWIGKPFSIDLKGQNQVPYDQNDGLYKNLSKKIFFFVFFWNCWWFPDDDGTDSHRKGYTGGISIKNIMIFFYVFGIFLYFFSDFFLIPGVRKAIFRISRKKIRKMAGPAAGSRHRARQPGSRHRAWVAGDPAPGPGRAGPGRVSIWIYPYGYIHMDISIWISIYGYPYMDITT